MTWLKKIESLKPGDACEFRFPARNYWKPAIVVRNGGGSYWTVKSAETFVDRESNNMHLVGETVSCLYIEHIRLPGQTEAWPRY
jgi:hypothetical protein